MDNPAATNVEESELRTIGKYQVLGALGRGSMGVVYKARDPEIGRLVAIKTLRKLLPTHLQNADAALERFRNEARSAGNLRHPHIITIFDINRDGDTPYIVMDFVEGASLETVLEREKKLPLDKTLHYLSQVAAGLDYAHTKGIVHKDIKPGNIFVDRADNVFILDFGIATITESIPDTNMAAPLPALGTPGYMSPEQILNDRVDMRSDLFSLAIVAFECLAGERPFLGATFTEVVSNILNSKPRSLLKLVPTLPFALEAEFERALSKERTKRFATAKDMIDAFAAASGVQEQREKGYLRRTTPDSPWKSPRRRAPTDGQLFPNEAAANPKVTSAAAAPGASNWPQRGNPGAIFAHRNDPIISAVLDEARVSPVRTMTFVMGAIAVVMAMVLGYIEFGGRKTPPPPPVADDGTGAVPENVTESAPEAPADNGALVTPSVEAAPAGIPIHALTDKQLLGVLVNPKSSETELVDALHEASNRRIAQLVDACVQPLQNDSYVVRIEAIKLVADLGDRRIVPRLLLNLDDHDPLVRSYAAKALGTLGDRAALGYLTEKMVSEEMPDVKAAMQAAIDKINGFPMRPANS